MQHAINGVKLHWREAGAGDPVVFIHGFPFRSTMWGPQLEAVPDGWRFIAPDLRGFGESERGDAALTIDLFADDVVRLLDHLAIDQAVICGLSMGGYVALSLATRYPDRLRALVLIATRASADSDEGRANRKKLANEVRQHGPSPVVDSMLPKLLTPETVSKRPEVVKQVRDMMLRTKPEGAAAALRGMAERDDQTELLAKISVPTLIIVGAGDAITPVADSETMHQAIPGSRLVVLENAGHVSNLERTEQFNDALVEFQTRISTDGP